MDRWLVAESVARSKLALGRWGRLSSLNDRLELPRLDITNDELVDCATERKSVSLTTPLFGSVSRQTNPSCFLSCTQGDDKASTPRTVAHSDVEARALITSTGSVNVPRVIASGVLNDRAFIVEQLIAGHHPQYKGRRELSISFFPPSGPTIEPWVLASPRHSLV